MDIFDKISARLTDLGMTQADLARATGISTGLISQWKKRTQKPSAEKLKKVADALGPVSYTHLPQNCAGCVDSLRSRFLGPRRPPYNLSW